MADSRVVGVTRDVEPTALGDLLARPPRATVSFVRDGMPELLPARARLRPDRGCFAVADTGVDVAGREVVLVADDGPYWFQLRGVSMRGVAVRAEAPPGEPSAGLAWYAVEARRVLAWDYGTLREA